MNSLKDFLKYIACEDKAVICFGTGLMAEEALQYPEIGGRVRFFCDNDRQRQNARVRIGSGSYETIDPKSLPDRYGADDVILITSGYFKDIRKQIDSLGFSAPPEVYDFPVLKVSFDKDSPEFFEERILKECLKEYRIVLSQYGIKGDEYDRLLSDKEAYIRGSSEDAKPFVVPRTIIMPTTRCNLRCKGCSSLLPLFTNPQDVDASQIISDCDVFFSAVDECIRLTVGGEPFLYPDLGKILERLINEPKLLGIMLITNGMKIPDESLIPCLQDGKVLVEVSDYGRLESMSRVVAFLERNHVNFKVLTEQFWTDMGGVEKRGRSREENRFVYMNCDQGRVIKGMHDGRFHTCARSARMLALGAYDSDHDYFELAHGRDRADIRKSLMDMYYSDHADACDYCDLGALPTHVIEAGIQMNAAATKSTYTIVKRSEYEKLLHLARIDGEPASDGT